MIDPKAEIEKAARAIELATCRGREGPFGGYDYGHNTDFYGPEPEGGRYVVRDFRDPSSPDWGKWVHQTADLEEHEAAYRRLTEEHIATAAIEPLLDRIQELEAANRALRRKLRELGVELIDNVDEHIGRAAIGIDRS